MEEKTVKRNVRLFYVYLAFREPLFWGPILIISIQKLGGMSLSEVYFMESFVLILYALTEFVTGSLADTIGRKKTVLLGTILETVGMFYFACMQSPIDVWIANILFMTGITLCSGADEALLYDLLVPVKKEHNYMSVIGTAVSNRFLLIAVASLITGVLADMHLRLPLLLSVPGMLVSVLCITLIKESGRTYEKYSSKRQWSILKLSVLLIANHRKLKWIILFSALIGVSSKLWFFTYNPYFELVSLDIKLFGVLFFLLNVIAWFFSKYAQKIETRLGEGRSFMLMVACVALPVLYMGVFVTAYSVVAVLLQNVVRGMSRPFFSAYLNRHVDSEKRATVISASKGCDGIGQFFALGLFGYMLTLYSLPTMLVLLGITVLLLGILGIIQYYTIT